MNSMEYYKKFLIITWCIVSSLIALIIIGGVIYFKIINKQAGVPEVLTNWGGMVLGFYFGSFASFAKDILFMRNNNHNTSEVGENETA